MTTKAKPRYKMTRLTRYMPNGRLVPDGRFYVRFYGPRHGGWVWHQASKLVANKKEALVAFHEWVEDTENYLKVPT